MSAENILHEQKSNLTAQHLARVLFYTFKFSQGSEPLQGKLMEFEHKLHPDWILTPELLSQTQELGKEMIARYFAPDEKGQNIKHLNVSWQIAGVLHKQLEHFQKVMAGSINPTSTLNTLAKDIARGVLRRDHFYLVIRNSGRPRVKNQDTFIYERGQPSRAVELVDPDLAQNPLYDKYFSYFKHYILDGNPTGLEDFNLLFKMINHFWRKRFLFVWKHFSINFNQEVMENMGTLCLTPASKYSAIKKIWEEKHPGEKFEG